MEIEIKIPTHPPRGEWRGDDFALYSRPRSPLHLLSFVFPLTSMNCCRAELVANQPSSACFLRLPHSNHFGLTGLKTNELDPGKEAQPLAHKRSMKFMNYFNIMCEVCMSVAHLCRLFVSVRLNLFGCSFHFLTSHQSLTHSPHRIQHSTPSHRHTVNRTSRV